MKENYMDKETYKSYFRKKLQEHYNEDSQRARDAWFGGEPGYGASFDTDDLIPLIGESPSLDHIKNLRAHSDYGDLFNDLYPSSISHLDRQAQINISRGSNQLELHPDYDPAEHHPDIDPDSLPHE